MIPNRTLESCLGLILQLRKGFAMKYIKRTYWLYQKIKLLTLLSNLFDYFGYTIEWQHDNVIYRPMFYISEYLANKAQHNSKKLLTIMRKVK